MSAPAIPAELPYPAPTAPAGTVLVWTTETEPPILPTPDDTPYPVVATCTVCGYDREVGSGPCGEPCL